MSLQQNLSYSPGMQPASCYQNSPASSGYHCQRTGENCVGGNASLAESSNFFNPKLTGNYHHCIPRTTGSIASPGPVPSNLLSMEHSVRALSRVVKYSNSMQRRVGRFEPGELGYMHAAGVVINSLNSGVPLV